MPIESRDVARLCLVFVALVACVLVCVNCVLPRQRANSVHALVTPAIPRCDSVELLLSPSAVNAAQVVGREEYSHRWADARQGHEQDDALALRVELARQSFEPGEPIPLRVVISNQAGRALTFLRPTRVAARPMAFADLVLEIINSAGERMVDDQGWFDPGETALLPWPQAEDFSTLPAGGSCSLDFELTAQVWGMPEEPLPPGDYEMRVVHYVGNELGPQVGYEAGQAVGAWQYADVGAFAGRTGSSNSVAFTVRPLDD